jgi:hypothetical protein
LWVKVSRARSLEVHPRKSGFSSNKLLGTQNPPDCARFHEWGNRMNPVSWPSNRESFDWKPTPKPFSAPLRDIRKSSDPSMVTLSAGEMQRLIDIERSAEAALSALRAVSSHDQRVTDAASALANALANPALGG